MFSAIAWVAPRVGAVGYAELVRPTDLSVPLPLRVAAADPSIVTWMSERTGYAPPMFETDALIRDYAPVDAALWTEDNYFRESQQFINTRELTERVTAGYAMTQGRAGALGFLAGVRQERTEVDAFG